MVISGTPDTLEKDNEILRVKKGQFKAKCGGFAGGGKVKLSCRTKTTGAAELQRRFRSQHRQVDLAQARPPPGRERHSEACHGTSWVGALPYFEPKSFLNLWQAEVSRSSLLSAPVTCTRCRGLSPARQYIHPTPQGLSPLPLMPSK